MDKINRTANELHHAVYATLLLLSFGGSEWVLGYNAREISEQFYWNIFRSFIDIFIWMPNYLRFVAVVINLHFIIQLIKY